MDWLEELDKQLSVGRGKSDTASIAKGIVEIDLNILVRFSLGTDARMKMLPNQWDVATYHGDKTWEIKNDFDFGELGEVLLIDESSRGSAIFSDFVIVKGQSRTRTGFIIPEKIGEEGRCAFFVAYEANLEKATLADLWNAIKPAVKAWYESLLRDDLTPLIDVCESRFIRQSCPRIPGNL
ncbi:MAG: hypothetical protein GKC03_01395 [Methanomassiliicoccales archaeon]|nr:hypothetical protein [Methanomassiliicoccales archaeon]NYT14398.1 hypothetical protein [Methanomassiliicoccales archaeon]